MRDDDPNLDRDGWMTNARRETPSLMPVVSLRSRARAVSSNDVASLAKDDGRSLRARAVARSGIFARVDAGDATRDAGRAVETRACV